MSRVTCQLCHVSAVLAVSHAAAACVSFVTCHVSALSRVTCQLCHMWHVSVVSGVSCVTCGTCPTVGVRLARHADIALPALVKIHRVGDRLAEVLQLESSPPGTCQRLNVRGVGEISQ